MTHHEAPDAERSLSGSPAGINRLERRLWRAAIGLVSLPIIAGASWYLAGSQVWHWIAILSVVALLLLVISAANTGISALRIRHFVAFSYFVLSVACWIVIGYLFPVTKFNIAPDKSQDGTLFRVANHGTFLFPTDPEGNTYQFRGRIGNDHLTVESLTPDGWVVRDFSIYGRELELKALPTTNLYIDNRRHGAAKMMCGALPLDVAAEFIGCIRIPSPKHTVQCFVDGEEVGSMDEGSYVIDISGAHSYVLNEVVYASKMFQAMSNLDHILQDQSDSNAQGTDPLIPMPNSAIHYAGQYVYRLPKEIDFFLTPHTKELETYYEDSVVKTEFVDAY